MNRTRLIAKFATAALLTLGVSAAHAVLIDFLDTGGAFIAKNETDEVSIFKGFSSITDQVMRGTISGDGAATTRITENISNSSLLPWTDYHVTFEFTPLTTPTTTENIGVSFISGLPFTQDIDGTINLELVGGSVASGTNFDLVFDLTFETDAFYEFVITQRPSVSRVPMPEPTSLALVGLGLAGMGLRRRSNKANKA